MRILIAGAGAVGYYLAKILSTNHQVTLIEKRKDRCEFLRPSLTNATIICEDGCEPSVLEMGGIGKTDLVVTVTGDDEDNLVISYLSKFEYDVDQVIARVNNPKNRWLFTKNWGVDVEVSAPDMIAKIIEEETTLGEVVTLFKLQASDIGLVEITIPDDAEALGESLAKLELPPETLVVTVIREKAMMIPDARTVLQPNDRILAITNVENKETLERLLGH
ncbi:MAG: NAD-binding protein [Actinomycetia bacterium]|nr:NAD-binding protein [Actinomycetes bacterium]